MTVRALASLLLLAASSALAAAPAQNALEPHGVQALAIHDLWRLTLLVCTLVFAAVLAAFLYAIWRAPRSKERTAPDVAVLDQPEPKLRRPVVIGVAVSTILLVVLIVADFVTERRLAHLPLKDAVRIEVTGHLWWWGVRYLDDEPSRMFSTANEIHVPAGKPVILKLNSADVIHSFWAPSLHGKKDLIPGRTALLHFRADKPGVYRGQCAEFCGFEHALMAFTVVADPPEVYEAWAARQRQPAPAPVTELQKQGLAVFMRSTCAMCHTIAGTEAGARLGPDLTHLASRSMIASGTLPNTRQYLAAWILDPQRFKKGANMPPTPLSAQDLNALMAYLETLK
ncbi:cytochrome c oxidase subunit II [Massilia sp. Mn16-1_5]|uniref:cytochrome c oxidase subunit II n=1 Tax=Massilia sp. Mn16-1_5 TaxID=2079199 RepID=UPI00109EC174|nr:cytochrome c oxidase subunit II [Massilia sp. Mn16-1_5]THC43280.1 cytochrome c oxidase subunit II [Massilia sp. Mn16-1_5]